MTTATDNLTNAMLGLCETLRSASNDPADQVRLFTQLATLQRPVALPANTSTGAAVNAVRMATDDMARRSALVSLALASAAYQPTSYEDAVAVMNTVCNLLDLEITNAADKQDRNTYLAFRELRTSVSADLSARGTALPRLAVWQLQATLPSLAVAYRLYADATRTRELVTRANPRHPLWMPAQFEALSR